MAPEREREMLALWLLAAVGLAAPEDAVQKMLDAGDIDKAEKKCEDVEPTDSATLRELCAKACNNAAQATNTAAAWHAYVEKWAGTSFEAQGRDAEAKAALHELGEAATEAQYKALLDEFGSTASADSLKDHMGAAAIRDAFDADQAVRVAKQYPGHENLPDLVERYPEAFLHATVAGETASAVVDPPAGVDAKEVAVAWMAKMPDGTLRPWSDVAREHLESLGLSKDFIDRIAREGAEPFPPCTPVGAQWTLGVQLQYGEGTTFVADPGDPACGPKAPPALFLVSGGRVSAFSLSPGHRVLLAPATPTPKMPWFPWRDRSGITNIFAPLPTGEPILAGTVIGQAAGDLFLLSPIAGGMPWYVKTAPPANALHFPADFKTAPLPEGWTFRAGGHDIAPGTVMGEPIQVVGGTADWWLPSGDPRVFSTLFARLTTLSPDNPAIARTRGELLPMAQVGFTLKGQLAGPPGSSPITPTEVPKTELTTVQPSLAALGVTLTKAWRLDLGQSGPQVLFEGTTASGGPKVKGVLDTAGRIYVWTRDERAAASEQIFAFSWRDHPYFAWTGTGSAGPYVEAVHYEEIGLVREWR
jgi:hypothetical protein